MVLAAAAAAATAAVTAPTAMPATTPIAPAPASATAAAAAAAPAVPGMRAAVLDVPAAASDGLDLTITATRLNDDPNRVPPHVSTVTPEDLRRRPLAQTPDLLEGEPGVLVQRTNWGGGSPFIHGLTGKQILLMVDGVRLNNSLYRFGPHQYLNTIDPFTIERIEVLRGPSSVLYGTDALGGVVHVITRDPQPAADGAWRPGAGVGAESADRSLRGRLQLQGTAAGTGVRMGGSARVFDDLWGGGGVGRQVPTAYREAAADLKLTRALGSRFRVVGASTWLQQHDVPKTSEVTLDGKVRYDYEPQIRSLTYLQLHGDDLDAVLFDRMRAAVSFQLHGEGEQVQRVRGGPTTEERNDARTPGAFLQLALALPLGQTLGYGVDVYHDTISSHRVSVASSGARNNVRPAFPDDARYLGVGAWLQDDWQLAQPLRLTIGGRYSRYTADGHLSNPTGRDVDLALDAGDLTGSLGVVGEVAPGLFLTGQAARGFRAPNMEDFFGKVDFASEIPNEDLQPETSWDFEAGLKTRHDLVRTQALWFRNELRDLIDRADVMADVDGDGTLDAVARRENIGRARIEGVETEVEVTPVRPLALRATYAWTQGDQLDRVRGELIRVGPLRRIPPQQGLVAARWQADAGHFVMPELVWADRQDRLSGGDLTDKRIPAGGTAGYAVVHLRGGVDFGAHGLLKLGVENIFDQQYKAHGSGVWYPGRNVYAEYAVGL